MILRLEEIHAEIKDFIRQKKGGRKTAQTKDPVYRRMETEIKHKEMESISWAAGTPEALVLEIAEDILVGPKTPSSTP